jgi:hypothetical protein
MWKAKVRKPAMVLYQLLKLLRKTSWVDMKGGLEMTNHLCSFGVTRTEHLSI